MKVKICGITNSTDAHNAISLGVDALGVILFPDSPRYVEPDSAVDLFSDFSAFVNRVGVFVNQPIELVNDMAKRCKLDYVQLHGDESVEFCQQCHVKVIKAFRVSKLDDINDISRYQGFVNAVLLDTKINGEYGGTGQSFDWSIAIAARDYDIPLILSGGINITNVKKAVELVNPYAIDLSSGVEELPGKKDYQKMEELMRYLRVE